MFNYKRLNFTFLSFLILLAVVLVDIFQLQTQEFDSTSEIINRQNLDTFYITAPRGEMFDTNGNKIVETILEPHLFVNLRKITDQNVSNYKQIIEYNFPELDITEITDIFTSKDILKLVIKINYILRLSLLNI